MRSFLLISLLLALGAAARADVTTVRHFRLGETDAKAAHGEPAGAKSVDTAGVNDLVVTGAPAYSAAVANSSSSLSLVFNGTTQYATTGNWHNLTTNFGVEAWVKPTTAEGQHYIIYNGQSAENGWGIVQNSVTGKFSAVFGGRTIFGQGTITPGVWTHLAIVCTDSLATFYVNGAPSGTTTDLPLAATGSLAIGANASTPASEHFAGNIDEVRIFTFTPGAFSTADLLFNGPPVPPTLSLKPGTGQDQLFWPTWDRGFGLQTSTTLLPDSWTTIAPTTEANGLFSVTRTSPGPNRFYRLKKPAGEIAAPRLPAGKYIVITTNNATKNVTTPSSQQANRLAGNTFSSLDASAFEDPADVNGGANSLDFHWEIFYPTTVELPRPYSCKGVTGYRRSVLRADANSFVNQPQPFSANGPGISFRLVVTSRLTGLSTEVDVRAQVISSALTLTIFNHCQTRETICPNGECSCTIAAALPTNEPL